MTKKKIKLGDEVRDTISGYQGIVTAVSEFLNGCVRCGIQSQKLHEGKPIETYWIDEPQLELVKKNKIKIKPSTKDNGGPMSSTPKRASDPK